MVVSRKNPDFTASAERLSNSPVVLEKLQQLREIEAEVNKAEYVACRTPEYKQYEALKTQADIIRESVRATIDEHGGYQDIDRGIYGLKQLRRSYEYRPELVKEHLNPKVASLVLVESVDKKAVSGLIKGGIITPEQDASIKELVGTTSAMIIQFLGGDENAD
ncbi:MAG: hypothetical protein P3T54_00060 [Dehalogenimonas sp.]|nr:hypothetical protein [Dehalogenimonas sp.]